MLYNPATPKMRGYCKKFQGRVREFYFWRSGCVMSELVLLRKEGSANEKMKNFILQDRKIYFVFERYFKSISVKIFNIFVITQIYHTNVINTNVFRLVERVLKIKKIRSRGCSFGCLFL